MESIRITKTRLQQLSQISIPSEKMLMQSIVASNENHRGIKKRKTFIVNDNASQDSS